MGEKENNIDVIMRDSSVINSQTMKAFRTGGDITQKTSSSIAKKNTLLQRDQPFTNEKNSMSNSIVLKRLVEKNKVVERDLNRSVIKKHAIQAVNQSIYLEESDLLDETDYLDVSMLDKKTATMSFIPNIDKLENLSTQSKVSSKYSGKISSRYDKVVSLDLMKKHSQQ